MGIFISAFVFLLQLTKNIIFNNRFLSTLLRQHPCQQCLDPASRHWRQPPRPSRAAAARRRALRISDQAPSGAGVLMEAAAWGLALRAAGGDGRQLLAQHLLGLQDEPHRGVALQHGEGWHAVHSAQGGADAGPALAGASRRLSGLLA